MPTPEPPSTTLPTPSAAEQERSAQLARHIHRAIAHAGGAIDFATFMALALYTPELGYYSGPQQKFGAHGDFITAPELSPLFARCLAQQCVPVLTQIGAADILEVGAGSGALAAELLAELENLGTLPRQYFILELSAPLRARQEAQLRARVPHLCARVQWLDTLPPAGWRGIVLANEVLDAMPVQRFAMVEQEPHVLMVATEGERFIWRSRAAPPDIATRIAPLHLPSGYVSEINLQAEAWIRSVADVLDTGLILLIDYGFPRAEFYHPQRAQGTLMCHYRHRSHDDPFALVGLQDITAHIDFTAMAEAADAAGLSVLGFSSQAAFLLSLGLAEPATHADTKARLSAAAQIQKLTSPAEMGELFKVLALGRNIAGPLRGFSLQDRRGRL